MAADTSIKITIDGVTHTIEFGRFNALDARLFRQTMGVSLSTAFSEGADLDVIAGVLWLQRRKTNPALTFEQVASKLTFDDLIASINDDEDEGDGEGEDDSPET